MKPYIRELEPRNEIVADQFEAAAVRYALRLNREKRLSVVYVLTALLVNAAVKEQQ